MPEPLLFGEASDANKAYIRKLLAHTVENTAYGDGWSDLSEVPSSSEFFKYNAKVNGAVADVASHKIIDRYIMEAGEDYRFQEREHPVRELRDRTHDNVDMGRVRRDGGTGTPATRRTSGKSRSRT